MDITVDTPLTFVWPLALVGLLGVPIPIMVYRRRLRRQADRRGELARLGLIGSAPRTDRWRHLPAVLIMVGLIVLLVGLARPQTTVAEPRREGTVVLAFDTSASMAATDVVPTRIEAAKIAARAFVAEQPASIKIGVVTFGGVGTMVQQPTTDQSAVLAAIDRLTTSGGTAIGAGIRTALTAIAGRPVATEDPSGSGDVGYYGGTSVIMLTDGENTERPDPVDMAELASVAGVKIFPIGLGSAQGAVIDVDGYKIATRLDEQLLTTIASTTDGTYYAAADADSLRQVYASISLGWTARPAEREITSWFALVAALLLVSGVAVSIVRTGRVW